MAGILVAFTFVLGLVVGSFLNVCILRIPAGESVVRPASHCPKCNNPIAPYDNIPLLSWLVLRGKCRHCLTPISTLYPAIELLTGILFIACYLRFEFSADEIDSPLDGVKWAAFCSILVVLAITDLRERILPDRVNLAGALIGLVSSLFVPIRDGTAGWIAEKLFAFPPPYRVLNVADSVLGAVAGVVILWIFLAGWPLLVGYEGMGWGDVKMMAMVGTFLGPKATVLTIMVGAFLGVGVGVVWIGVVSYSKRVRAIAERANRRDLGKVWRLRLRLAQHFELPFGTFLACAGILVAFCGGPLISWYFSRIR